MLYILPWEPWRVDNCNCHFCCSHSADWCVCLWCFTLFCVIKGGNFSMMLKVSTLCKLVSVNQEEVFLFSFGLWFPTIRRSSLRERSHAATWWPQSVTATVEEPEVTRSDGDGPVFSWKTFLLLKKKKVHIHSLCTLHSGLQKFQMHEPSKPIRDWFLLLVSPFSHILGSFLLVTSAPLTGSPPVSMRNCQSWLSLVEHISMGVCKCVRAALSSLSPRENRATPPSIPLFLSPPSPSLPPLCFDPPLQPRWRDDREEEEREGGERGERDDRAKRRRERDDSSSTSVEDWKRGKGKRRVLFWWWASLHGGGHGYTFHTQKLLVFTLL